MRIVTATEALDPARNARAAWHDLRDRPGPQPWPAVEPSFEIEDGAEIFTIGSCFARNVEEHLARLGYSVPALRFSVPETERRGRPNGILNKHTPPLILQEIEWAASIFRRDGLVVGGDCERFELGVEDGAVIDTNLSSAKAVSRERFLERRREVYDVSCRAFAADYVVMTLGLVEAWYDRVTRAYVHLSAILERVAEQPNRFELRVLDYADCLDFTQRTIDAIRALNPSAKFLITTSPVPLKRTFTDDDVLVANACSKSILRAVCGAVATSNDAVDYFPSYEAVVLGDASVWDSDRRRVRDAFVGKMVERLLDAYAAGKKIRRMPSPG